MECCVLITGPSFLSSYATLRLLLHPLSKQLCSSLLRLLVLPFPWLLETVFSVLSGPRAEIMRALRAVAKYIKSGEPR